MFVPEGIQLVASCLTGEVMEAAKRRLSWERSVEVKPLRTEDRQEFIGTYLGKYRKSLTPAQEKKVLDHALAGNPLFLRTLLEELRVFGVHEELERRLDHYLTSATVDDLYERVLERIEQDTAVEHVRSSMEALWASRAGLAQDELLAITGLASAQWAAVQLGLDEVIIESGGRLIFAHDYLRKAVEDRYGLDPARQQALHRQLGEHFAKQEPDERVAEELPWQWQQAEETERLKECLTQRGIFLWLHKRDDLELLGYWLSLPGEDLEASYGAVWEVWGEDETETVGIAFGLAEFLQLAGRYGELAERLYRQSLAREEKTHGPEHPITLLYIGSLAGLLGDRGDYADAKVLHRRTLTIQEKTLGLEHTDTLRSVTSLAALLGNEGNHVEAESLFRRVLVVEERIFGPEHEATLTAVHNLGCALTGLGDSENAEPLVRRALAGRERVLGADHLRTLDSANNLANLLQKKRDHAGAEVLYRRALSGIEKKLGPEHPRVWLGLQNLGTSLHGNGDLNGAEDCLRRALKGLERALGPEHPTTLGSLDRLTHLLLDKGDYAGAEPLYRRKLEAMERILGPEHPDTFTALKMLALSLVHQKNFADAIPLYRRIVEGREKTVGPEHPDTFSAVNMLAVLHCEQRDFALAEALASPRTGRAGESAVAGASGHAGQHKQFRCSAE
jgi:tetratricopeptide (TPR) repeat protein